MPIYDRPIDSSGFQPLTTASSMENYGVGNMVLDMGLAIGAESLGAGLMGAPGMFGGKPLMGYIPGVSPGGASGSAARGLAHGIRSTMGSSFVRAVGPVGPTGYTPIAPSERLQKGLETNFRKAVTTQGGKITPTSMFDAMAKDKTLQTKGNMGLANRLGIGMGLRAFSQAWIVNDLFSLGFSAASSAIQGIESFSYERRARVQEGTGLSADLGEGFADTRASFTQRQRAMQAIHNSQMNTRAAMGNEATFMHV